MGNVARKTAARHELFAREWVIDMNGTRAAIAAGFSEFTAAEQASRLLKNVKVQRIIQSLQSKRASKLDIKADRIAEELARMGFANMHDYIRIDGDGRPTLDMRALDRDKFAAIQEIREDATGGTGDGERRQVLRTTFKLHDKKGSLELLGRHLGMFQDNVKVTGLESLAKILAEQEK